MRSDSWRDVGAEMSHDRRQEHPMTGSPFRTITPRPSPTPALPLTFRRGEPVPTSEQELKRQMRRQIAALSVHHGKTRIASWALEDELQNEYEERAAAWKKAEHCNHLARYTQDELRIQAWEREQRAKHEAEMQRVEAEAEQMKVQAQAKMGEKLNTAQQKSQEKHAALEARKARDAETTDYRAEVIRKTERITRAHPCCLTALRNLRHGTK